MATEVKYAIRTTTRWTDNQAAMEALYGVDGYYTLFPLWEDDIPVDLVSIDEQWIAEWYDDWPTGYANGVNPMYIQSRTTSATQNIILTVPDSEKFQAINDATVLVNTPTTNIITVNCAHTIIEHLRGNITKETGTFVTSGSVVNIIIRYCKINSDGTGASVPIYANVNTGTWTIHNNLITSSQGDNYSAGIRSRSVAPKIYNNTVIGFDRNYRSVVATEVYNDIGFDAVDYDFEGTINGDYNASEDNTASGANSITSITSSEFEDYAADDYSLSSGSSLRGAGTNLTSLGLFTKDMLGNDYPPTGAWDLGVVQYVTTVPTTGKIYLGGTEITAMKLGSTDVTRAYLGSNQVFGS